MGEGAALASVVMEQRGDDGFGPGYVRFRGARMGGCSFFPLYDGIYHGSA
jgi:hypothetical protein